MMQFIRPNTSYPFIPNRKKFLIASAVAVGISLLLVLIVGPKYGIDFAGGTEITVGFLPEKLGGETPDIEKVRAAVKSIEGVNADTQAFGDAKGEFLIKMQSITYLTPEKAAKVEAALKEQYGAENLKRFNVSEAGGDKIEFLLARGAGAPAAAEPPAPAPTPAEGEAAPAEGETAAKPATTADAEGQAEAAAQPAAPVEGEADAAQAEGAEGETPTVFADAAPVEAIKELFAKADIPAFAVKIEPHSLTNSYRYVVTLEGIYDQVRQALDTQFGAGTHELLKLDTVGPRVGAKLKQDGILACIYSLIGMLIYIALRFEFKFAPGAIVALVHDVLITMGVFIVLGKDFNLSTIAALLTIVGYSVNDTIVVFDRIRENMGLLRRMSVEDVFNKAINETLSRTILTSFTTFITVFVIWLLTVGDIQNFAFAMMVGLIVGTYSSIFVASPVVIWLYQRAEQRGELTTGQKKQQSSKA